MTVPFSDKCSLRIPFPSWARDDPNRPELDFENWKELSRWADRFYRECLPSGGGGKLPFYVAAADASDESKALANYQCTGSNDHLIIQQAVDEIRTLYTGSGANGPGAAVWLSEGTFNFGGSASSVKLYKSTGDNNHVSVRGMGPSSTFIEGGATGTTNGNDRAFLIDASTSSAGDALVIEGVRLRHFSWAIREEQGAVSEPDHCRFRNCYILDCYGAIYMERGGSTTIDCVIETCHYGVYSTTGGHNVIDNDFLGNDIDVYFESVNGFGAKVSGNISYSPNDYFFQLEGYCQELMITDNKVRQAGTTSILLNGGATPDDFYSATISDNTLTNGYGVPDISVEGFGDAGNYQYPLHLHNNQTDGSIEIDVPVMATGNFAANGMIVGANCDRGLVANNWLGDTEIWAGAPSQTLTLTGTASTGGGNYLDGTWT